MAEFTDNRLSGVLIFCLISVLINSIQGTSPIQTFEKTTPIFPTEHSSHLVNATVPIVFEGKPYREFYISKDGRIVFTKDKAAVTYQAQDWSAPNVAPFIDLPFIAPYYHNGEGLENLNDYTGHVFYRIFDGTRDYIREKDLLDLGKYIGKQVVGSAHFHPTWGISITWERVTSSEIIVDSQCKGTTGDPCPTNTFQLILLTDGSDSYTIFNYGAMSMVPSKNDQAGFNGGHGAGFTRILPDSRSIQRLNQTQGSDQVGRFIYKISSGQVFRGGCSNDPAFNQLSVHPNYAGMFGGQLIDISGPCFTQGSQQQIVCSFEDPNHVVDPTREKATRVSREFVRCVVPRLLIRDRVILSLSLDGGQTFTFRTNFTIIFPGRMAGSEFLKPGSKPNEPGWFSHNATSLTISWNTTMLTTSQNAPRVDIRLIGYRETGGQVMYKTLATLGENVPALNGLYTFNTRDYQCSGQDCFDFGTGLVEVRLQDQFVPNSHKFLSTKQIALGWFVQNKMKAAHGADWPSKMCMDWYNVASRDMGWFSKILKCPCSMAQAMADFGRWQPDTGCNLEKANNPRNCFYHNAAVHCVRSVQPVNGAGNQCCYSKQGYLVFAADSFFGSTADKGHDWGAAPYGQPLHVPILSHWVDDIIPLFSCCQWTNFRYCSYYMELRPTTDCTEYNPPVPASVYGQGHIATFGGQKIRMFGPGDYILLRAGNTEVQARFQKNLFPTEDNKMIETTYSLTAVAVQDKGTSDRVELRMRGPDFDHEKQHIDVLINGEFTTFDESSLKWQEFKGVAVINTDKTKLKSNFTVLLTNGIGFQLADHAETLQLDLMTPSKIFASISGLLGNINGVKTLPSGVMFNIDVNKQDLYNKFELAWAVDDAGSIFNDFVPANHSTLGPIDVNPSPLPGLASTTPNFCTISPGKKSDECIFDYRYTGSEDIARASREAAVRYAALSSNLQPVRSCGLLNVPHSFKSNYSYTIGTTTTITGCRTGSLSGTSTYDCVETSDNTQEWSPAVTATCKQVTAESADIGMIVGIVVAISVVVIIALVIAFIAVQKRRRQEKKSSGETATEEETVAMKVDE